MCSRLVMAAHRGFLHECLEGRVKQPTAATFGSAVGVAYLLLLVVAGGIAVERQAVPSRLK